MCEAGDSTTYLVNFPEGSIAQFSHYLPDVVGINVPVHVLVLLDFLLYIQSWKTKDPAEFGQRHLTRLSHYCLSVFVETRN